MAAQKGILGAGSSVLLLVAVSACAGPQAVATSAGNAGSGPGDGGLADAAPLAPVEHPFAKSAAEATDLIQNALETRMGQMWKCIDAKRARAKNPHLYVVVNIGIDQEGTLIGVSALKQADTDETLNHCLMDALDRSPWPKSHAGIITVKQEFTDKPTLAE
jgi:hypothetical protein